MAKTPTRLVDTQPEADTRDDYLLAQMLQLEFDREHDSMLTAEEKHYNKHSKGLTHTTSSAVIKGYPLEGVSCVCVCVCVLVPYGGYYHRVKFSLIQLQM